MVGIKASHAFTMPDAMYRREYVDAAKYIGVHGFPGAPGHMLHDAGAGTAKYEATMGMCTYRITLSVPRFESI